MNHILQAATRSVITVPFASQQPLPPPSPGRLTVAVTQILNNRPRWEEAAYFTLGDDQTFFFFAMAVIWKYLLFSEFFDFHHCQILGNKKRWLCEFPVVYFLWGRVSHHTLPPPLCVLIFNVFCPFANTNALASSSCGSPPPNSCHALNR